MEVPLSRSLSDEAANGSFFYTSGSPRDRTLEGVFAFSLYLHYSESATPTNPYIRGVSLYLDAIEKEDSVFAKWKIVLYTDAFTVSLLKDPALRIGVSPHVDLVIVTWPYYEGREEQVNGDVLRCMRFRAFFDFPAIPVFIRDADTLWAITEYATRKKILNEDSGDLYRWESTFYTYAKNLPATYILGTSLSYKRQWHHNQQGKRFAPVGAFAGFQSATPGVPCLHEEGLWDQVISYILSRSIRTGTSFSNEGQSSRIGKDEQIITYLIVPACFQSIFFFEIDVDHQRTKETKEVQYYDPEYPAVIFDRGSNTNLKAIFEEGIASAFATNLSERQSQIFAKNKERYDVEDRVIAKILETLGNTTPLGRLKSSPLNQAAEQYYALTRIQSSVRPYDKANELADLYAAYVEAEQAFAEKRRQAIKKIRGKRPGYNQEKVLDELRVPMETKTKAIRTFLEKALSFLPRAELDAKLLSQYKNTKEMTRLLNWYEGKSVVPLVPPPSLGSTLSLPPHIASIFQKKGGTRRKKNGKQRTHRKRVKN